MAFVVGCTIVTQVDDRAAGILLLGACVVFAVAFVIIDRRAAAPLLPRQLTGDRRLRQEGALGGFLNTATTSSVVTLLTLYLQNTLHRSPLQAAATLLPFQPGGHRRIEPVGQPAASRAAAVGSGRGPGDDRRRRHRAHPVGVQRMGRTAMRGGGGHRHRTVVRRRYRTGHGRRGALARWRIRHHQYRRPAGNRPRYRGSAPRRGRDRRRPGPGEPAAARGVGRRRGSGHRQGATRFTLAARAQRSARPGLRQSAPAGGAPRLAAEGTEREAAEDAGGGVKDRARLRLRSGREVLAGWPGAPTATAGEPQSSGRAQWLRLDGPSRRLRQPVAQARGGPGQGAAHGRPKVVREQVQGSSLAGRHPGVGRPGKISASG